MTIWKFPILDSGWPTPAVVEMPSGAEILSLQMQHGKPTIWAKCDQHEPGRIGRHFVRIGTGWTFDGPLRNHVATLQDEAGFVWHWFELYTHSRER
jgi:hypothetical protein